MAATTYEPEDATFASPDSLKVDGNIVLEIVKNEYSTGQQGKTINSIHWVDSSEPSASEVKHPSLKIDGLLSLMHIVKLFVQPQLLRKATSEISMTFCPNGFAVNSKLGALSTISPMKPRRSCRGSRRAPNHWNNLRSLYRMTILREIDTGAESTSSLVCQRFLFDSSPTA